MSTSPAVRNPQHDLVAQVRQPDFREEIKLALPENMSADKFIRVLVTALLDNPDLVKADRASLFQAGIRGAQMGLLPDGREAALTVFGGKVVFMDMIGGLRKIAGEYGWVLRAAAIYENDEFTETIEPPSLTHKPARLGTDRGKLIGAYAVAIARDGRREHLVFTEDDIAKRRQKARSKNVWNDWTAEMFEKTVARRLFKKLPLDPADRRVATLIAVEDMAPGESAQLLYGPHGVAAAREVGPSLGADGGQQAGGGADETAVAHEAPALVPPPAPGDASGDDFGGQVPAGDPTETSEDDVRLAGLAAGHVVHVQNKDTWVENLTLAQVAASTENDPLVFFRWCLDGRLEEGDLKSAVAAFARVHYPFLYDQHVGA